MFSLFSKQAMSARKEHATLSDVARRQGDVIDYLHRD